MSLFSGTDTTFTGSQLVSFSSVADTTVTANGKAEFQANQGSLDVHAVTSGTWTAGVRLSIIGQQIASINSATTLTSKSSDNTASSTSFSTPIMTFFGQDALTITASTTDLSSTSTGVTSFLTSTAQFTSTGGAVSQTSATYTVSGTKHITGTFTSTLALTATTSTTVVGGSFSAVSSGDTSITASKQLTIQSSPPVLGNENDYNVLLNFAGSLTGVAKTDLKLLSSGSDKLSDVGLIVSAGPASSLTVKADSGSIIETAFNGMNLRSGGATSILAKTVFTTAVTAGGYVFDTRGALAGGGSTGVSLTTLPAAGPSGTILIDSSNAQLGLIAGSTLAITSTTTGVSFTGDDGAFILAQKDIQFTTTTGDTIFQGATIAHITAGSDTQIGTGLFTAPSGPLTATAGTSLRVHSLSRIANANKVAIAISTAVGNINVNSRTDTTWHADGAFSFTSTGAGLTQDAVTSVGDAKFQSQNEGIVITQSKGSLTFTATNSAIVSAGGQTGSVLFESFDTMTLTAANSLNYFANENVNFAAGNALTATATSDVTFLTNDPTSVISVAGSQVTLTANGATSPGVKVDARAIEGYSAQLQVLATTVNIGTAHTLFNPRFELRGSTLKVDSVGGTTITSDSNSININSYQAGVYMATEIARLTTQGNAYIAAPKASGTVSFSTSSATSRLNILGAVTTSLSGTQVTFTSTAENIYLLATANVGGNDIVLDSKSAASFSAPAGAIKWTSTDLTQANTVTTDIQSGSQSFTSLKNIIAQSDNTIAFTAQAGTIQFATSNRNGAKLDVTTAGERSDITISAVGTGSVTASSAADVEVRGANVAISTAVGTVTTKSLTGDVEFIGSGQVTFAAVNSIAMTALDDIEISTANPTSTIEIDSSAALNFNAGEQIKLDTLPGEGGDIEVRANANINFLLDDLFEVEPDQDLFVQTRTGAIQMTVGESMDILTDGYLDVFAGRNMLFQANDMVEVYSDLGKVHIIADVSASFSAATTLSIDATDGFVWLENGNQTVASRLLWNLVGASTVSADFGGSIFVSGEQGVSIQATGASSYFRSVGALSMSTTALGGEIQFLSTTSGTVSGTYGVYAVAGDSLPATTETRTGGMDFEAALDISWTTTGDTSTEIRLTSAGLTEIYGTNLLDLSSGSQFTVHSSGAVEILSEEGNADGLTFTTVEGYVVRIISTQCDSHLANERASERARPQQVSLLTMRSRPYDSDISLRTNTGGSGNVVLYANEGMVLVTSGRAEIANINEGIEFIASTYVEISNARGQGAVAGVIFDSVDDIRLVTFNDDVVFEADNIVFGVFSLGTAQFIASDGDPANGISLSAVNGGITSNTGSALIQTLNGGHLQVSTSAALTQTSVNSDVLWDSNRHLSIASQSFSITSASDIQLFAPNGAIIFNPQPEGRTGAGGLVRILGTFLVPSTNIMPNNQCSVEQEMAIDELAQLLCVCERQVWYCV